MSMHLEGPYLTTLSTKKTKTKITKAKQAELETGWKERNKMLKSIGLPKESFEQYMEWVFGQGKKTKTSTNVAIQPKAIVRTTTTTKTTPVLPAEWYKGATAAKESKVYTGDKMIGVATMHKSNMVPVFSDDSAKDISKMRR